MTSSRKNSRIMQLMSRYAKRFIDGVIVARLMSTSLLGFERSTGENTSTSSWGAMVRRSSFNSSEKNAGMRSWISGGLPESKHEYEDTLPIPTKKLIAPQFLYILPDEYALFKCVGPRSVFWQEIQAFPNLVFSGSSSRFVIFKICLIGSRYWKTRNK